MPKTNFKADLLKDALSIVKSLEEVSNDARMAVLQAIERRIAANSAAMVSQAESTSRTKEPTRLPELPAGLKWPTENYSDSAEAKRGGGGIVSYLHRVWHPILEGAPGLLDLRTLREIDPSAAMGITNFKRGGNALPDSLKIPTKREINDQLIASQPRACLENPRFLQMVAARHRRGVRAQP